MFIIDSLHIGGAEKSLVSLLNNIDFSIYDIHLIMFKKGGELENLLPQSVNILETPGYFLATRNNGIKQFLYTFFRLKTSIKLRLNKFRKDPFHSEQVVYESIKTILNPIEKRYDVAIAYSQGMPTYFVCDKVNSGKKIAWINTDYKNTLYNKDLDYSFYQKFNEIIAVSENTRESVVHSKEEYKDKLDVIKDIVDPELIIRMSNEYSVSEFEKSHINILTVGRLATVKGYDKAIKVAALLKEEGYKFKWVVVGEGPERHKLQTQINKLNLNDHFLLIGEKLNPYVYMKSCDIYVQTSLKEGFGLTVSEAKILKRPIICTNFPTAKEIINHEIDGLIVEHDIHSIFKGVKRCIDDDAFRARIVNNLEISKKYNTLNEIGQFYKKING
ncbi:glycosyltransferase [Sutcliffiella rhizosphaerae]|uniref:glycosyltransferase n=1 Tax=Sutcliffiella rhizosphaerae TaxID=2880967 RepID=UPI001E3B18DD|nr:glycosyltransferase [Sutcliffiella rhizosphaerae]